MTEEKKPLIAIDAPVDDSIRAKQERLTAIIGNVLNLMTAFAAPRYLAQMDRSKEPNRDEVLEIFDEFLVLFDRPDVATNDSRVLIPMRELRRVLATWTISSVAPASVMATARECLHALGVPEPDEGWDRWEPRREALH